MKTVPILHHSHHPYMIKIQKLFIIAKFTGLGENIRVSIVKYPNKYNHTNPNFLITN